MWLENRALQSADEVSDKLLDRIYDAATDTTLWRKVLTDIADLTKSQGAILFGQSVQASRVYFDYNGRLDETCNRVYRERHMQNCWSIRMEQQPTGRIVLSDEVVPLSALQQTLFFEEVLRPQDVAHNAMIALAARVDFRVAFNLCRSRRQGQLDRDGQRVLASLAPHLVRSVTLGFRVAGYRILQRAEFSVLDHLSAGIILLDRACKMLYANEAARLMTSGDGPLATQGGQLTAASHVMGPLEALFESVLRGKPIATMSIPHATDGRAFTILVVSIRSGDFDRFVDSGLRDPALIVMITDPLRLSGVPAEWLMDAYGLTRSEANVALGAGSIGPVHRIAGKLGISTNTVKTHLRRVFAKTGVARQSELAQLIASFAQLRASDPGSSGPGDANDD